MNPWSSSTVRWFGFGAVTPEFALSLVCCFAAVLLFDLLFTGRCTTAVPPLGSQFAGFCTAAVPSSDSFSTAFCVAAVFALSPSSAICCSEEAVIGCRSGLKENLNSLYHELACKSQHWER